MKIQLKHVDLHLNGADREPKKTKQLTGEFLNPHRPERVEISQAGRELAAGVIEHHAAQYYGGAEIQERLNRILDGQTPEVRKAVSTLIQFNFHPDGTVAAEADRAALMELGLSQAQYIADKYLEGDAAEQFLSTMHDIAKIAKTGTDLPLQKPQGAPDDYLDVKALMQRFEPETYAKLNEAMKNDGNWSKILLDFAKKVPQHKEWMNTYHEERGKQTADWQKVQLENRFAGVDTSDLASFVSEIKGMIQQASVPNPSLLTRNMDYFAYVLMN